jgi:Lrp/AsnC family transcriptional regulator, regulator for asnA, asnC and gidA
MVDSTDRKIIKALTRDARLSNAQLARELDIAVSTVARRIDALLRENIISIKALPNPYKMGCKASAVIGLDVDLRKVDIICSRLVENSHLSLVVTTFGRFDMLVIADYKDHSLLTHFIKQDLLSIDGVHRAEPYFVTEVSKRYSGMFSDDAASNSEIVIDDIDQRLCEELGKNGRIAYSKLADDMDISIATVSRRIASLVKQNMIKITAVPNPAKFGFLAIGCVFLHTDFTQTDSIASQLVQNPDIHLVMKITNTFDIFFITHFPSPAELYLYLKTKIATIGGVSNMETFVISEIVKLSTTATGLKVD